MEFLFKEGTPHQTSNQTIREAFDQLRPPLR